jgi:uncharacterized membrane protein
MRWERTVLVDAPADLVWRLTLDITSWPSFVPTVRSVERLDQGPVRVGSSARIKQPGQTPAVWTVTKLDPGREFTWQTRRLGTTMTGSHAVEAVGDRCRCILAIDMPGPFGAVFGPFFRKALDAESAAFKAKAERSDPPVQGDRSPQ